MGTEELMVVLSKDYQHVTKQLYQYWLRTLNFGGTLRKDKWKTKETAGERLIINVPGWD